MENIKICGIVICALCILVVFRNMRTEYSLFIRLAMTIGISVIALAILFPILNYINEISKGTELEKYIPSLIKALGIACAVQITADVCKDAGEDALAGRIFLFGQAEILVISIPIMKNLFALCSRMLG